MLKICGFYKHQRGTEYIIWEDESGAWHVTDGIIDVTDKTAVKQYLMILHRVPALLDHTGMMILLRKYQPDSPLIGLLK